MTIAFKYSHSKAGFYCINSGFTVILPKDCFSLSHGFVSGVPFNDFISISFYSRF